MDTNKAVAALVFLWCAVARADDKAPTNAPRVESSTADVWWVPAEPTHNIGASSEAESAGVRSEFTIFGTWNAIQAMTALIRQYENGAQSHVASFTPCDSNQILGLLSHRDCDVGVPFDSFVPDADRDAARQFETLLMARFVVAAVVNATSPVRTITVEELHQIFTWNLMNGRNICSWKDVKGARSAAPIEMFRPDTFSPASLVFRKRVGINGPFLDEFFNPVTHPRRERPTDALVVEEIISHVNAIGFIVYRYEENVDKRIRILGISPGEDVLPLIPSPSTVADGSYPLADTVTLYLHPEAPVRAKEFCEFATGPEGAKIIRQFGLWPEYELEKVRGEQRVADVKAGKGEPVAVCDMAGVGETIKAAGLEFARAKMAVQLTLDAAGGSVEAAVAKLKMGEAELLVMDGGMVEEGLRGRVTEEGGEEMVLGSRAVGVVVHPASAFNELTMDDLRQILAGKVDRWPGATGTAERIVLYGLPPANPLMQLVDRAMGSNMKRAKVTVRPDSERVILSVAAQPGSLGLVDLTKIARHETKVKLLAILSPGETEAGPPAPDRVPDDYPLAQPVHLYLSPRASDAARSFFAFLNEGGGRDALLAGGLVPRPLPEAMEAEIAAAYGLAEEPEEAIPLARLAAAKEDDSSATAAPDRLQDVLRDALSGSAKGPPPNAAPAVAPAGTDQTAENAAAAPTPLDPDPGTPRHAEETETITPAPGEDSVPHPVASESLAAEAGFAAWIATHAVPIGLIGLGVTAVAVALGSLGMKRARHRKDVMRRYRP